MASERNGKRGVWRKPWPWVAGVFVAVLAVFGRIQWLAADRWSGMLEEVAHLRAELERRSGERPVLLGTPVDGEAWENYAAAALARTGSTVGLVDVAHGGEPPDPDEIDGTLVENAAALEALVRGARATRGTFRQDWSTAEPEFVDFPASVELAALAATAAGRALERGEEERAIELALAGLQFGRDHFADGVLLAQFVGCTVVDRLCAELASWLVDDRIERSGLELLTQKLALLDGAWPGVAPGLRMDMVANVSAFAEGGGDDIDMSFLPPSTSFWRYLFSTRLLIADWWDHELRFASLAERCEALGWGDARSLLDGALASSEPNPLTMLGPRLPEVLGHLREARARLRIVRAAVVWRLARTVPGLADPFGEALLSSVDDDRVRIWSVGVDGRNDGGLGDSTVLEPDADGADLALSLPKGS